MGAIYLLCIQSTKTMRQTELKELMKKHRKNIGCVYDTQFLVNVGRPVFQRFAYSLLIATWFETSLS